MGLTTDGQASRRTCVEYDAALQGLTELAEASPDTPLTLTNAETASGPDLFAAARIAGAPYRTGCGMASRKQLSQERRARIRTVLFRARYVLDARIETTVRAMVRLGTLRLDRLFKRQVFGFCKKQGVSFRLSLSTCVPTPLCGGGCYAHDGRERLTSTILSGCYNTLIAQYWEEGVVADAMLLPHIRRAVELAKADASFAATEYGITRRARIRLAHVGELAAYPRFANWLGHRIREESGGSVDGVIYTRHPKATELDTRALIVNFTVDDSSRNRRAWAKEGMRIVWSAWDGKLDPAASINFLEHHDHGQHALAVGEGTVCPVTASSTEHRFCDAFKCTKCFDEPAAAEMDTPESAQPFVRGTVRTRHQGLLRSSGGRKA